MSERLVDVEREELRDGDEVIQTDRYRGRWSSGRFAGPVDPEGRATYQRIERDPELPTTPGAVIWGDDDTGSPGPAAYQLTVGRDGLGWYRIGRVIRIPSDYIRVHAVLRGPGAAGGEG